MERALRPEGYLKKRTAAWLEALPSDRIRSALITEKVYPKPFFVLENSHRAKEVGLRPTPEPYLLGDKAWRQRVLTGL